ncbi:MAG: hypothetical protein B6A08_19075 [Sorangiineae bacterium NIC37A_2]|nr:MAG: hypothetical protein B6A08_19075 [Sorangiineae bacterium NIC37A_2]
MTTRDDRSRAMIWLALPGAVALVALGVVVGRAQVRPAVLNPAQEVAPSPGATDDRRIAVLEQELRRLRAEVAAGAEERARSEGELAGAPRDVEQETELDPGEQERAAAAGRLEYLDGLSQRVETEPRDARFRAETEPALLRLLPEHLGPDVQLNDVVCAASVCRVTVSHPGSARLSEERLTNFMLGRGALGEMSVQLDVREDGETTFYFLRGDG